VQVHSYASQALTNLACEILHAEQALIVTSATIVTLHDGLFAAVCALCALQCAQCPPCGYCRALLPSLH
jgi:cytidine deaminase